ncbi:hypothetical protein C7B76_16665 [filamentous cyanobacterium CCP2]|nr:hypothetical protein C7B76_16665 [filamentous cyanobacterium CCP2]
MKPISCIIAITCGLLIAGAVIDGLFNSGIVVQKTVAIIGRPATPISGAGVARRTTRRVIRRSTIYAATLPVGCSTVVIEGASLYQCGATYYQPYGNQYVVVYVD